MGALLATAAHRARRWRLRLGNVLSSHRHAVRRVAAPRDEFGGGVSTTTVQPDRVVSSTSLIYHRVVRESSKFQCVQQVSALFSAALLCAVRVGRCPTRLMARKVKSATVA